MTEIADRKYPKADLKLVDAVVGTNNLLKESIDLVITSPPYFVGKEYDQSQSVDDFRAEVRRVVPSLISSLKGGGSLCIQVGNHVQDGRLVPLDAIVVSELINEAKLSLRNRIIWTFGHGEHASTRFSGRHETILWYSKIGGHTFNLDDVRVPQRYPGKRHYRGQKKGDWSGNPLGKNPGDVWDIGDVWGIPNVKANHVEKTHHPCQFPIALARRLVAALSPKDGLVLDPYVGSGTTVVAALLEGRRALGFDLESKYLNIAASRIEALNAGTLRYRQDIPVEAPNKNRSVSKRPPHFTNWEAVNV